MNRDECLLAFVTILRKDPTLVLGLMSPFPGDRDSSMRDLAKHIAENTPEDSKVKPQVVCEHCGKTWDEHFNRYYATVTSVKCGMHIENFSPAPPAPSPGEAKEA